MGKTETLSSISQISRDLWTRLAPRHDPVWNWSLFRAMERSRLADGFAYIASYRDGELIAVLPVFWFSRWKMEESLGATWRAVIASMRKVVPGFMIAPTLFCGNLLGAGFWLGLEKLDASAIEAARHLVLALARELKLPWVIFKDYPLPVLREICPAGPWGPFALVPALPDTVLQLDCTSFDEYVAGLKIKARRNTRSKLRKFGAEATTRIERVREFGALIPDMMQLYEQVYGEAEFRFDHLNAAFFDALLHEPALDKEMIVCWRDGALAAFALCLFQNEGSVNLRLGLDYERIAGSLAYFAIHYESIRAALDRDCKTMGFSITSYEPKIELGCNLLPLSHGGTHTNSVLRPLIAKAFPLMMRRFDVTSKYPSKFLPEQTLVGIAKIDGPNSAPSDRDSVAVRSTADDSCMSGS